MTDLKNRGLEDILIASIDNLKGFAGPADQIVHLRSAITSTFSQTQVLSCVIHQIRNSLKYVASKDRKEFMQNLKPMYAAVTKPTAEEALLELVTRSEKKYPLVVNSW